MISHQSDLLLFDQTINYHPRAEVWLLKTEYFAQETIGKLIGHAVSSFPKQPLDEWIIDYPQQTILSTIHLILTHEINEMLHDMRVARGSEGPSMTQSGPSDTMGLVMESSHINTRSIHQLQDTSRITSQLEHSREPERMSEHPEEEGFGERSDQEGEGHDSHLSEAEGDSKEQELKSKEEADKARLEEEMKDEERKNSLSAPGGRLTIVRRQEEEAKIKELEFKMKEEKLQYILDMFGADFNIKTLSDGSVNYDNLQPNQFKDEAMRTLQEKSFHGLYLRLQFWINQIYKRLQNKAEGCNFKLHSNHMNVMKTIICFLSYMRDVVMDLKLNGVNDYESYEWQKQIRLTWNATEPG